MNGASPERPRRADIQGLRALAVAGVVAAHLTGWPAAGYLGVDVFFVVSGFVITGVLLRAYEREGRVRVRAFFARRARRILPLALLVLVLTVVASAWAFAGPRLDEIRTDAVWAALFAANWHFAAVGSDYFALGQSPSPVQHFWSLGVEEQFYLVWPWLVSAATAVGARAGRRRGRAAVGVLCGLVCVLSLAWAAVQSGSDAVTAYYSSFTRAWELGLGAALACVPAAWVQLRAGARTSLSWLGLLAVVASFALLRDLAPPFPAAVLPAAGTLAVLAAGIGRPVTSVVVLTNRVSRYLGDISYGLYLWHFPLVVLLPVFVPAGAVEQLAVVALTLLLATVSYHLLERPVLDAPTWGSAGPGTRRAVWAQWWATRRRGIVAAGTAAACLIAASVGVAVANPGGLSTVAAPAAVAAGDAAAGVPAPAAPSSGPTVTPTPSETGPPPVTTSVPTTPTTPTAPTPTTAAPVPLGATGEALRRGLAGALAAGAYPADLAPRTDQWPTTQDQSAAAKPCPATVVGNPSSCTFGNPDGPEIDVYGDSLGIPLLTAVVAAYGKTHKVRGLTKIACAVNGADANYGKDEWAVPCVNHQHAVVEYVQRTKPAVLLMIETYAWATKLKSKATGDAMAAEWTAADQALVDQVRRSAGHVVIVSPSIPGVAFLDCYKPGAPPSRCATGIPTWWQQTQDAEKQVQGVTFLDTLHWYCVDGRCPIFTTYHDTVLKGDYLHPSVQYMRLVADDLAYRLSAAGVLPPG